MNRVITLFFATVLAAAAGSHTVPTTGVSATLTYSVVNDEVIITECNRDVSGELVIPSIVGGKSVISIGDRAFIACKSLTSVTIPDGVTSIGDSAFWSCASLTNGTIGKSVTSIGDRAFFNCESLTSVTIPNNVDSIGTAAFENTLVGYDHEAENLSYLLSENGLNAFLVDSSGASGDVVIPSTVNGATVRSVNAFRGNINITSVTIPNGVTSIGSAFGFTRLTSVTIPDGVTSIGERAFENCTSLTSVMIPDSVTSIEEYAFSDCESLTSVTIPDSVTSIEEYVFSDCESLTSVTIPDRVTSIGEYAFSDCESLTSVTIGNSVTSIGTRAFENTLVGYDHEAENLGYLLSENGLNAFLVDSSGASGDVVIPSTVNGATVRSVNAFRGNVNITRVTIPDGVTSIAERVFQGCTNLASVTIGTSVTSIMEGAFFNCSSLIGVTIPDSVTSIGGAVFSGCTSLTSVTIPDSVTSIEEYAFYDCSSLTGVTIPDSVTSIGKRAFLFCMSLTSVTIGNSVTSVGEAAFQGCTSLTSVTIPDSVTAIGNYTFSNCSSLTSVIFEGAAPTVGSGAFSDLAAGSKAIVEPVHVETFGGFGATWNNLIVASSVTIPTNGKAATLTYRIIANEVIVIDCNEDVSGDLVIPGVIEGKSVTSIGERAFENCTSLTSVMIPDSVISIEERAFGGTGLTSVIFEGAAPTVGSGAFSDLVEGSKAIIEPVHVETFGGFGAAWNNLIVGSTVTISTNGKAATLTYLIITNEVIVIDCNEDVSGDLVIPGVIEGESVTSIGEGAFENCTSLTSVMIPDSVTSIEEYAFSDCESLTSVTIGNSVTLIGTAAFENTLIGYDHEAENLSYLLSENGLNAFLVDSSGASGDVVIPSTVNGATVRSINAFQGNVNITSMTIPDSVISIGEAAFQGCTSLTSVTIPDSVTSIEEYAFSDCASLTSVTIGNSVTSIGTAAFENTVIGYDHEAENLSYLLSENGLNAFLVDSSGASGDVVIPSTVNGATVRSVNAFRGNVNIISVTIPGGVTSIGERAFQGCASLNSVIFEGGAPTVGSFVFLNLARGAKAIVQPVYADLFGGAGFLWNGLIVELAELQITRNGFVNAETFFIEFKAPGLGYRVMSSPTLDFSSAVEVTPTLEPISTTDNRFEFLVNDSRNFYRLEAAGQ